MRKCENCGWEGNTHMTAGQVVMTLLLWIIFFPIGIIYSCAHARKCPKCGNSTVKIKENNNENQ